MIKLQRISDKGAKGKMDMIKGKEKKERGQREMGHMIK